LDLACGSGRNAIWLAEQGWKVTAVDRSETAIGALLAASPGVDARIADLEAGAFAIEESTWDLILMSHYLQRGLFEPAKRGLRPGGLLIAILHLFEPGHEHSRFSLKPGELAACFTDCEILHSREGKPIRDPQGRAVAEIVARASTKRDLRQTGP
jgi:SAM-dependent methyltransferase